MNAKRLLSQTVLASSCFLVVSCGGINVNNYNIDFNSLSDLGKSVSQTFSKSDAEERAIGRESAAVLLGASPLSGKSNQQKYVNQVGRYLADFSDRPELEWRFGIIDHPAINAFAAPGGYVFVTKGLMDVLQNEAQLAAVLAHEITHVVEKHHLKELQKTGALSALTQVGMLIYKNVEDDPVLSEELADKVLAASKNLYTKGLSKQAEYDADAAAIGMLQKAGYDSYALFDVLQILDSRATNDSALALMFKTHPKPRERIEKLLPELDNIDTTGKSLQKRFKGQMATR